MVKVREDLTGRIFGKLTVIKQVEDYISPKGERKPQWLCECDCEDKKQIITTGTLLKKGQTKSCGCLQRDIASEIGKKTKSYNAYNLSGEYGIGYTSKEEEFYFDLEDYNLIKNYCWYINSQGYVVAHDFNNDYKTLKFHRLVMGITDEIYDIDHKHGKKTRNDNRKCNIRIASRSQNVANKGLVSNNTSGITGVTWYPAYNKWLARITVDKKRIHLGYFTKFEDAIKARKEAEEKYFGEFSYDNSIKEVID